jgi:hypothetical protein
MAGYLGNMLESKDYIIRMFKDELVRKNQLIEDLLERQDYLETRLAKIEAVLIFDDADFEAQTGIKKPKSEALSEKKTDEQSTVDAAESSTLSQGETKSEQVTKEDREERLQLT